MPKSNYSATIEEVAQLALPNDSSTATHIATKNAIDELFNSSGLIIDKEEYRIANEGEFMQGTYTFTGMPSSTYALTFTWISTYNKTAGFKSSFGVTNGGVNFTISSENNPQLKRVSIEDQKQHAVRLVTTQLNSYRDLFDEITRYLHSIESTISLTKAEVSELTGELFFNDLISVTQLTKLRESLSSYGVKTNKSFTVSSGNYLLSLLAATQFDNKPSKWLKANTGIVDFIMSTTKDMTEETKSDLTELDEVIKDFDNLDTKAVLPGPIGQQEEEQHTEITSQSPDLTNIVLPTSDKDTSLDFEF